MEKSTINSISGKPYTLIFTVLLALGFRLIILSIFQNDHLSSNATLSFLPFSDALLKGDNLVQASRHFSSFTAPLYAIFVAIIFLIFGKSFTALYIIQILLDSSVCLVLFYIGKKVFNPTVGAIAGAIYAVYPMAAIVTSSVGDEVLFTFFFVIFILFTIELIDSPSKHKFATCGVILGLATLTRSTTQAFPFVFVLFFLFIHGFNKKTIINLSLFFVCFLSLISPWIYRNYIVYGSLIPVALNGTPVLHGSDQRFFLTSTRDREMSLYFEELKSHGIYRPEKSGTPQDVIDMDRYVVKAGIENYKTKWEKSPFDLLVFFLTKFKMLWYNTESGKNLMKVIIINLMIYPLALIGLIISFFSESLNKRIFLYIVLMYFIAIHLIPVPLFRYLLPIMPILIIFESLVIERLFSRITKQKIVTIHS